ncbi:fibroblast growth factor 5 [Nerophis lumbriciformis]|uniref:fibroblast growth factor 5 n=1 Tax=Nerophis lumbriciformis TaxID=546530 RepID=UPI003BAAB246
MKLPLCVLTFAHLLCAQCAHEHEHEEEEEEEEEGRRTCRLYCRVGIGFHLQIHRDGAVNGSHQPDHRSVLELFAVSQGVVGIRGVYSHRFLAMNKKGRLHATESFTDDCKFRERFQESGYNTYASVVHGRTRTGRAWLVALNKRGKAKMGSSPRVKPRHVSTHFLPRVGLHDQRGFTVAHGNRAPPRKAKVRQAPRQVKYWPKYRFG